MRTMEDTLSMWVSGLLTSEEVVAWAGQEVVRLDAPSSELIDLLTDGPQRCLKRAQFDFPTRGRHLSYLEVFAVRAVSLAVESRTAALEFAEWAACNCMGEKLSYPMVRLGYTLDHYLSDCGDEEGAIELVRTELPKFIEECTLIAKPFLGPWVENKTEA